MKAYLITTATIFGLLTLVHIWRAVSESGLLGREPWFILITALSAALCVWACSLLRVSVPAR